MHGKTRDSNLYFILFVLADVGHAILLFLLGEVPFLWSDDYCVLLGILWPVPVVHVIVRRLEYHLVPALLVHRHHRVQVCLHPQRMQFHQLRSLQIIRYFRNELVDEYAFEIWERFDNLLGLADGEAADEVLPVGVIQLFHDLDYLGQLSLIFLGFLGHLAAQQH